MKSHAYTNKSFSILVARVSAQSLYYALVTNVRKQRIRQYETRGNGETIISHAHGLRDASSAVVRSATRSLSIIASWQRMDLRSRSRMRPSPCRLANQAIIT